MARALLLSLCFAVYAPAQTRTLELFLRPASGLDSQATLMMKLELQRLLMPAAIEILWKNNLNDIKTGEAFDFVAVSSFEGACSAAGPKPMEDGLAGDTLTLAATSASHGHVLPFFTVDCARVKWLLKSQFERMDVPARQLLLGRALGRIMAHEIYHIVGETADHSGTGVAKAAFSVKDLMASRFEFDQSSLKDMMPAQVTHVADSGSHSDEER